MKKKTKRWLPKRKLVFPVGEVKNLHNQSQVGKRVKKKRDEHCKWNGGGLTELSGTRGLNGVPASKCTPVKQRPGGGGGGKNACVKLHTPRGEKNPGTALDGSTHKAENGRYLWDCSEEQQGHE